MAKKAFVYDGTQWVDIAQSTTDLTNYAYLPSFNFGMRNKIINGDFRINQRGYTSGSNLDSGAYGFDRWKSNYTDTTLTFTSAPQGQTVTINVGGSVSQIIERSNMPAGTYVLSWTGTAIGSVFNSGATAPVGVLSPLVVTLDGSADVVVQFGPAGAGTATLGNVQLEAGSVPSSFENRPIGIELALCQRYYIRYSNGAALQPLGTCSYYTTTSTGTHVIFPVEMRVKPVGGESAASAIIVYSAGTSRTSTGIADSQMSTKASEINITTSAATAGNAGVSFVRANNWIDFDAEL
jgi:hypothetical protein